MDLHLLSPDKINILSTTKPVVEHVQHLSLNYSVIPAISKKIKTRLEAGLPSGESAFGQLSNFVDQVQLIFLIDTVNFCFWAQKDQPKWQIDWPPGHSLGGAFGLNASFQRAVSQKVPILDSKYLCSITSEQVLELFRTSNNTQIPLLSDRVKNLQESGSILAKKYSGKFINLLESAHFSAPDIVKTIVTNFTSFKDISSYRGHLVNFYKRAQICVYDISLLEKGHPIFELSQLTAFADYKLPQMLRHFGLLIYSPDLSKKVDSYSLITADSPEEVEIRAATIWGVELIHQSLPDYTAAQIDNALWYLSQDQTGVLPYHRTYSIYY